METSLFSLAVGRSCSWPMVGRAVRLAQGWPIGQGGHRIPPKASSPPSPKGQGRGPCRSTPQDTRATGRSSASASAAAPDGAATGATSDPARSTHAPAAPRPSAPRTSTATRPTAGRATSAACASHATQHSMLGIDGGSGGVRGGRRWGRGICSGSRIFLLPHRPMDGIRGVTERNGRTGKRG